MADSDLEITFSGDASGLKSAAADAGDAIKGLGDGVAAAQESLKRFKTAIESAFKPPDTSAVTAAAGQAATGLLSAAGGYADLTAAATAAGQASAQWADDIGLGGASVSQLSQQFTAGAQAAGVFQSAAQQSALGSASAFTDAQAAQLAAATAVASSLTAINAQSNAQVTAANRQAAEAYAADWKRNVTPVIQTFGDGLLRMAQGSESFSKVMNQVAEKIETDFVNMIARNLSSWLMSQTAQTAATQGGVAARTAAEQAGSLQSRLLSFAATEKQILNNAVAAATGAYNAMASIPIIGPALGAAAAAATFTAVEAFGNLASAAGGYDIPAGVNPLVQAHAEEMILPARIANPMRDMLGAYAANTNAPSAANGDAGQGGGDVHHWHISAMDPRSFETYLRRNSDTLAGALNAKVRAGAKIAGA